MSEQLSEAVPYLGPVVLVTTPVLAVGVCASGEESVITDPPSAPSPFSKRTTLLQYGSGVGVTVGVAVATPPFQ